MAEIILGVIGGLALFLYSIAGLSETMQRAAGEKIKTCVARFTNYNWLSVLTGTLVTALIGSSSAVIIITIILINSRVLTFGRAIGVVMGANIGTTIDTQIIAFNIGRYSPVFLAIGLVLMLISSFEKISTAGRVLLYFGMVFFGLNTMERSLEPLRGDEQIISWMEGLQTPLKGAVVGALATLIIQSSSATIAMAITLAKKGLMATSAGIAVMLGAELGTCSDTLLATIRGSRQAIKTGLFHLLFNLICIVMGLLLFNPFVWLVKKISGMAVPARQIANAHILFNTLGVLIFFFFIPQIEKLFNRLLPDKTMLTNTV
ncbi:MAG: Na/Pi symporter [Chitinophagales bacterium]|nr:Na/Pi symporter [Chitinophagales bacterium]MDW8419196.1 Na/Pi symporter [Chitinophagales bacterium]